MSKKNLEERLRELKDGISLLEEALQKVLAGDCKYFKVISGQLRGLICFGGRNMQPLLINLADEKNVSLMCYGPSTRSADTDPYTVLKISNFFIGLSPFSPASQKYEIREWLTSPFVRLGKEIFTPNEVIRAVAEKDGGAHYDEDSSDKIINLRRIMFSGQFKSVEEKLMIQAAAVVTQLGVVILKT